MARSRLIGLSGASGLLGSAFRKELPPEIMVADTLEVSKLDIRDIQPTIVRMAAMGIDTFLHLAWPASSYDGNYRTSMANFSALEKTLAIGRACKSAGITFLGIGSTLDRFPLPGNFYSLTKFVARQVFLEDIENKRIAWVRPFHVFDGKSWPAFIHSPKEGVVEILNDLPRDFIHVSDVASGLVAVLENRLLGQVDILSGTLRRPSDLCRAMLIPFKVVSEANAAEVKGNFDSESHSCGLPRSWKPVATNNFFEGLDDRE